MRFHGILQKPCCMTGDTHERIHRIQQSFPATVILCGKMLKSPVLEQAQSSDKKDLVFRSWWDLAKTGNGEHVKESAAPHPS